MDLLKELGDLGGLLIILIGIFMFVAMPLGIRYALRHVTQSPAEQMDRRAHPENYTK